MLGQQEGFFSSQYRIITSFWGKQLSAVMGQYENAKAKLQALIGVFLQNRARLIRMRERNNFLSQKAETTGNAALRGTTNSLANQIADALGAQTSLEGKVQAVFKKINLIESSKPAGSGVGQDPVITPTVVLGVIATVALVTGAVVVHNKKVNYLDRLLSDVEIKALTPAEAIALSKKLGGGLFDFGDWVPWVIGGAVVIGGLWFMGRRKG